MAAFIQKLFKSRKSSPTQDLPRHQPPAHVGEESGEDPRAEQRERQRRVLAGEAPEQTLAQLAIEGITAEIRLEAARRLTSQGVLTDVMKHSKGRDKGVYQIVKHALQTLKEEAQRQEAIANTIRTLIASAEDQARSEDTTLYQARLDALLNQWHAVEAQASAEQSQRFLEAVHRCRQRLQDIEAEQQEALRQPAFHIAAHLGDALQRGGTREGRIAAVAGTGNIAQAQPGVIVAGADDPVEIDFLKHILSVRRCRAQRATLHTSSPSPTSSVRAHNASIAIEPSGPISRMP